LPQRVFLSDESPHSQHNAVQTSDFRLMSTSIVAMAADWIIISGEKKTDRAALM